MPSMLKSWNPSTPQLVVGGIALLALTNIIGGGHALTLMFLLIVVGLMISKMRTMLAIGIIATLILLFSTPTIAENLLPFPHTQGDVIFVTSLAWLAVGYATYWGYQYGWFDNISNRTLPDLFAIAGLRGNTGIPLGYDLDGKVLCYDGEPNLFTFGPPGSGKTASALIPALCNPCNIASALINDVKAQLLAITVRQRLALGHDVAVLNPYNELDIPSATYNPLAHIDPNSLSFAVDCRRIAQGLNNEVEEKDHWEISATSYTALVIMWVIYAEPEKTLNRVREIIAFNDEDTKIELQVMKQYCDKKKNTDPAARTIAESVGRFTSGRGEVEDVWGNARENTTFLSDPGIQRIFAGGPNEIDFAELKRRHITVYVIIPPRLLHERAAFLRLITLAAIGELERERTRPSERVLMLLEEFAQMGHMPFIASNATVSRDYKLRFWFVMQSLPQFQAIYPKVWESVLSTGITQAFTPNDLTTAEYVSKRSGIREVWETSYSESSSSNSQGGGSGFSKNMHKVEKPVMSVQELMRMGNHEQVLLCPGIDKALLALRFPYFAPTKSGKTLYEGMYDPDPYHMTTEEEAAFRAKAKAGKWYVKNDGWARHN